MEIQSFIQKMKSFEEKFLEFVEDESIGETEFNSEIEDSDIKSNINELDEMLHMISKIAKNHFRNPQFLQKISQILLYLKEDIHQNYTNFEIFRLFQNNKPILLFLLQQQILIPDQHISRVFNTDKYVKRNYPIYFFKEFQSFYTNKRQKQIGSELKSREDYQNDEKFEQNRLKGENESYLCSLIRDDMVEDFIIYQNRANFSLKSSIVPSIFESNSLLLKKVPTLIEYAAFFGSIQIFNYLKLNGVDLDTNLWKYAIHGKNADIIHALEDLHVPIPCDSHRILLTESMKCHHSDIASYFKNNYMKEFIDQDDRFLTRVLQYFSFYFCPDDLDIEEILSKRYEIIKYGHINLVNLLIKISKMDINNIIIYTNFYFYKIPNQICFQIIFQLK